MKPNPNGKFGNKHIALQWHAPLQLKDGGARGFIYYVDPLDIPEVPGIYVFGKLRGETLQPIYIGVATKSLRKRIKQQFNNLRLMNGIKAARGGKRVLMIAELRGSRRPQRVLATLEVAIIRYALAEGYPIVNKSGTKIRAYSLSHLGNRLSRSWMPRQMEAEKLKPRAPANAT